MSSKAKTKFLEKHPFCCLCGGSVEVFNIEHAPPKALFIDGIVPAGDHRVPACKRCNNGSSQHDQVAALVVLTMASAHRHDVPHEYVKKLIIGVKNNAPAALRAIVAYISEAEPFFLRVNGILREMFRTLIDSELFRDWLDPWAAKQAYALHYLNGGGIIPSSARITVGWFTNANITEEGGPDELIRALPYLGELRQGRNSSEGQFSYKWGTDGENASYVLFLQESSIVILGVLRDASVAARFEQRGLFATNAEKGIHRVSEGPANG